MSIILITIGMFLVTYIPRMLPVLLYDKISLPQWANSWLKSIPYAALGGLIFPGIMNVSSESQIVGIVSGLVAGIVAYFNMNIGYVIGSAILVSVLMLNYI
ncbi:MAG: AzlD domain-containing protein [Clostridium sp.]